MSACVEICEIYRDKKYCRADKKCADCRHFKIACKIAGYRCPIEHLCKVKDGGENG